MILSADSTLQTGPSASLGRASRPSSVSCPTASVSFVVSHGELSFDFLSTNTRVEEFGVGWDISLVTRFELPTGLTFSNAAWSWRSCPSRHALRLLVLPRQTTPGTATPSNLPHRHHQCRSGVMDTGSHIDRCHLRERGRHLALSYPSQDPRQCVGGEKYLYSPLLWPGFFQLKYPFGFADSSPFLLPDSTRSVVFAFPDTAHASCSEKLCCFLASTIPRRRSC